MKRFKTGFLLIPVLMMLSLISCKSSEEGSISVTGSKSELEELHWQQATGSAAFSPRTAADLVSYDNQMWVIGGYDGGFKNDVWSSVDGSNWVEATSDAAFSPRVQHRVVSFNGSMWVIGGKAGGNPTDRLADIWYSTNGATWYLASGAPGFTGREHHVVLVYAGKLWVIGGIDASNDIKNDVWSTSDGSSWSQVTGNAAFAPRDFGSGFVFENRMWYVGGYNEATLTMMYDSWSSADGVNWTQGPQISPNIKGRVVVYHDRLYSIGGRDATDTFYNEVWATDDAGNWIYLNLAEFSPRDPAALVHNDKIWVIGGETKEAGVTIGFNDVWFSE